MSDADMQIPASAETLPGDINADGSVTLADAVLMHKWLLAVPGTALPVWEAGDLDGNDRLNAADLTLLKRVLQQKSVNTVTASDIRL